MQLQIGLFWILHTACLAASAAEQPTQMITLSTPQARSRTTGQELVHCFGGMSLDFSVTIQSKPKWWVAVTGELYQVSDQLLARIGTITDLADGIQLDSRGRHETALAISLPDVERITDFELRLFGNKGPVKNSLAPIRSILARQKLKVYPRNLLAPVRHLAVQSPFTIVDERGTLKAILKAQAIRFTEFIGDKVYKGKTGRRHPRLALYAPAHGLNRQKVTEECQQSISDLMDQHDAVIVFWEAAQTLPMVVVREGRAGLRIDVKMTILDTLPGNPQSQSTLLEILRLTTLDLKTAE